MTKHPLLLLATASVAALTSSATQADDKRASDPLEWFNALHRLDFSWLVQNRVLWHTVIWALSLAGLTISVSGTVIGWRRLRRKRHRVGGSVAAK